MVFFNFLVLAPHTRHNTRIRTKWYNRKNTNKSHIYVNQSIVFALALNRCCGHNFNVIDALDTSVFSILWHRARICVHWRCADTMIWWLRLHRRCQAIRSNMIWSWMMWQCGRRTSWWEWRRNYWADRCILTRLTAVWWGRWCWGTHRFVAISTIRFGRCWCIESEYILQWALLMKRKNTRTFRELFILNGTFTKKKNKKTIFFKKLKRKLKVHAGHWKYCVFSTPTCEPRHPLNALYCMCRSCIIKMGGKYCLLLFNFSTISSFLSYHSPHVDALHLAPTHAIQTPNTICSHTFREDDKCIWWSTCCSLIQNSHNKTKRPFTIHDNTMGTPTTIKRMNVPYFIVCANCERMKYDDAKYRIIQNANGKKKILLYIVQRKMTSYCGTPLVRPFSWKSFFLRELSNFVVKCLNI